MALFFLIFFLSSTIVNDGNLEVELILQENVDATERLCHTPNQPSENDLVNFSYAS